MRRRHLIWIVPLSAALLWGLVLIGGMVWHTMKGFESIGGSWQVARVAGLFHGPGTTYELYREDDSGLVRVDESVSRYRFYPPDCVVYQTYRLEFSGVVFAVCGERTPVAFMSDGAENYDYTADGLLLPRGRQLGGSTMSVRVTMLKPIDRIVALARQQPSYRDQWQRDAGFRRGDPHADDLVEGVERDDRPR